MLVALPSSIAGATLQSRRPKTIPQVGEFLRFVDPTTETTVVRLTAPSSDNYFPSSANRFISARNRFLVFSSNRSGRFAPHHLDLRSGAVRSLAETSNLDTRSLCLSENEQSLLFIDGHELRQVELSGKKVRTVAENVSEFCQGASASDLLTVSDGRLQRVGGQVLSEGVASSCLPRPGGGGCLFKRENAADRTGYWYASWSAAGPNKPLLMVKGEISFPFWSPDGLSILFLRQVEQGQGSISSLQQFTLKGCVEQSIAPSSQFAAFAPNRDASVFVGASRSKAQPTVVLLLRSSRREMTLCEHQAKEPSSVSPVFAPDSRRVYFQSDREGRTALYAVNVELLVEPTAG